MSRRKEYLLYLLSLFMVIAGVGHLLNPDFYLVIIPPGLPNPEWLNLIAGLIEITLGVFLLERRLRWLAAWCLIALFIAVFPANLYVATENLSVPTLSTYEVFKRGCQQRREGEALRAVALICSRELRVT